MTKLETLHGEELRTLLERRKALDKELQASEALGVDTQEIEAELAEVNERGRELYREQFLAEFNS